MTSQQAANHFPQNRILGMLTIVISWSVYIFFICPTIYWRDSAEFVASGYTLGVPHPAGSPTYSLISKIFTFLPIGDVAFRINLVSVFFGVLSVYLTYRVIAILINIIWPAEEGRIGEYSAFAGAMLFLFSATFWSFSEVAEVYSQQIFWLLLVIFMLLKAGEGEAGRGKYLFLAAFFYGLGAGTHGVMVLYLPAMLVYLYLMDKSLLRNPRKLFPIIFFLFLGLSVYLYVPIRSSADPWLDWGNPQTVNKLFYHLSDKKDSPDHFNLPVHDLIFQLKNYAAMLPKQLTYFGLVMAALGFVVSLRRKAAWSLLFLIFFIHFAFFVRNWRSDFGFIPTFAILSLWAGIGLHQLILFLCRRFTAAGSRVKHGQPGTLRLSRPASLLYLLMGVTILFSALSNRPYADKSQYYTTYRFGKHILESVEYKALLLDQVAWFMTLYFQAVENRRPDLSIVLRNAFLLPDLFYKVNNDKYPLLKIPEKVEGETPYKFMVKTIEHNLDRIPVYWYQFNDQIPSERVTPRGIVFQIIPPGKEVPGGEIKKRTEKFFRFLEMELKDPYFWEDQEGRIIYSLNLSGLAMYSMDKRYFNQAQLMQKLALQLNPDSYWVVNNFGILYEKMGLKDKAVEMYWKAFDISPFEPPANINLARLYHLSGDEVKSKERLDHVLNIDPSNQTANFYVGLMAMERGDMRKFMLGMVKVLERNPNSKIGVKAREALKDFRRGELKMLVRDPYIYP